MNTAEHLYTVCLAADRRIIMRVEAESDYDARTVVSRMTGWRFDLLTTSVKPVESEPGIFAGIEEWRDYAFDGREGAP